MISPLAILAWLAVVVAAGTPLLYALGRALDPQPPRKEASHD